MFDPHTRDWQPFLWSPDGELNPYRNLIVARVRDLVRNDGWASAAVTRTLDNVIGSDFRPVCKPDYYALKQLTGKNFDATWAQEFGKAVESHWKTWSLDGGRYCDVERCLTVPQLFGLAFRHKIVDGDALAVLHWLAERMGSGAALYATAMQIVDPDRLSNPFWSFDTNVMRGGVEVDRFGAPLAYHIEKAHIGDWFNAKDAMIWERVPRETAWGRSIVIHDFDHDRAAQHRGGSGMLASVLTRLKMLIKYDGTELDAAIINAIFGAYISSPYDQGMVESALGEKDDSPLGVYQEIRSDFHEDAPIKINDVRMPMLAPGEKIETVAAQRPQSNFAAFESAVLRNVAAGCGMSAQQISQNWSEVNYSSYRAAMLEAWKTFHRRRVHFAVGFAQPVFTNWLEEAFDSDNLPLPAGAPEFVDYRSLYARSKWLGPGKGYVDELAEKQGAILGMDASLSTLEEEVGTLTGHDWREVLDQREIELKEFERRKIPPPQWTGKAESAVDKDQTAKKTIKPPQAT
jgi:lambda family phage portal protein